MIACRARSWWLLLCVVACSADRPPATPQPSTDASPVAAAEAPSEEPPPAAATFACGAATCTAGEEACCASEEGTPATCVKRPSASLEGEAYREALVQACTAAGASPYGQAECGDSGDCSGDAVCCYRATSFADSAHVGYVACASRTECVEPEVCSTAGATCSDGASTCVDGACRRPAAMTCGSMPCSAAQPFCCVEQDLTPARCGTAAECSAANLIAQACMAASDCAPGDVCQRPVVAPNASCSGHLDAANRVTLCRGPADCRVLCGAEAKLDDIVCDPFEGCQCP